MWLIRQKYGSQRRGKPLALDTEEHFGPGGNEVVFTAHRQRNLNREYYLLKFHNKKQVQNLIDILVEIRDNISLPVGDA